jgi:hypothetical protein
LFKVALNTINQPNQTNMKWKMSQLPQKYCQCISNHLILNVQCTLCIHRRPGLVISTFGLAEIISCMPDRLVKIYIGYWQTCQYSCIYIYSYMLYVV